MGFGKTLAAALIVAGLCSAGLVGRARAEVVDLKSLEKRALERHFSLRAADARKRAAEANVREARSAYLPHIGFTVDSNIAPGRNIVYVPSSNSPHGSPTDTVAVTGLPIGGAGNRAFLPFWRTTANLVINSTIYDFGRTSSAVAASRARAMAADADEELTRAQVVAGVRQAYLSWLSTHELHRMSESGNQDSTARSQRVGALIQEGARPRGDLAPVESDRLLSQLELERSVSDLESARMALEVTVGEPLPANAEPDLQVLDVQTQPDVPKVDPSLRMLAAQRAATTAMARMQRRAGAPIFTANAGGGVGVQTAVDQSPWKSIPTFIAGIGIQIPIWDGGGNRASADATEAQADELRIQLESAETNRAQEKIKARLDAQHAAARKDTALQLVEVCRTRVTDTEAGYELGAMQFEQVQQARAMLRRAETEVLLAKVARAEAVLRFAP